MNFRLKPLAIVLLLATTQIAGIAQAQAQKVAAQTSLPAVATKAPMQTSAPQDWIIYDDTYYTPVVDDLTRHLDAARKAFDAKDDKKAAIEMRAAAEELKKNAARADKEGQALLAADRALLADDQRFVADFVKRINDSALKTSDAASAIESGKIASKADLDKAIDKAARSDIERRWLVTDVSVWYPVSEEPQKHFTNAAAAYARKDYTAAATDLRKAGSYLRLEAGRASGQARQALDSSVLEVDKLAAELAMGTVKDQQAMTRVFARADYALALAHRSQAAASWTRKAYDQAGYQLKAAAHGLESAAGWVGSEAKTAAAETVAEVRALGGKLASGAKWTNAEVARGMESLGNGINSLGRKIEGGN